MFEVLQAELPNRYKALYGVIIAGAKRCSAALEAMPKLLTHLPDLVTWCRAETYRQAVGLVLRTHSGSSQEPQGRPTSHGRAQGSGRDLLVAGQRSQVKESAMTVRVQEGDSAAVPGRGTGQGTRAVVARGATWETAAVVSAPRMLLGFGVLCTPG